MPGTAKNRLKMSQVEMKQNNNELLGHDRKDTREDTEKSRT